MKNKYQRMSKTEKKDLIINFRKTDEGKAIFKRLTRLMVIGFFGIGYSLFCLIFEYFNDGLDIFEILLYIPLYFVSIFFVVMAYKLRVKNLNDFAIKKL